MGKYRNESARLQSWDYGCNAAYFITLCTKDREHFFGEINNKKLQISPAGAIAYILWFEIKNHAKNIELGEFIVMPNHIHGVLILNGNVRTIPAIEKTQTVEKTPVVGITPIDEIEAIVGTTPEIVGVTGAIVEIEAIVGTTHALSQRSPTPGQRSPTPGQPPLTPGQQRFQNQGKNTISSIVGSYKSAVTKYCNRLNLPFAWQPRFYDHIIRNERSFHMISNYIKNNPSKWEDDSFSQPQHAAAQ